MGFVLSLSTTVSVVVDGVVFQNEMGAANGNLARVLGSDLAHGFNGDPASSNVKHIASLSADQQALVRTTYFQALRMLWVMYVAFAGLASVLNPFVRAHKLRSENGGSVLGADRVQPAGQSGPLPRNGSNGMGVLEMTEVSRECSTHLEAHNGTAVLVFLPVGLCLNGSRPPSKQLEWPAA
ncbi:hypothetical protein BBP40_002659 [Aspergillus hancockii]|nr:hypothetical protein BBP40_002659 [Aspergillus hancockii]